MSGLEALEALEEALSFAYNVLQTISFCGIRCHNTTPGWACGTGSRGNLRILRCNPG